MTIGEVEALIKTKTRNKVRIHRLEERVGDSVAFLSYSIDRSPLYQSHVRRSRQSWGAECHMSCDPMVLQLTTEYSRLPVIDHCLG